MKREMRLHARKRERWRAQVPARLAAAVLAGILFLSACSRDEPAPGSGSQDEAPAPAASTPSSGEQAANPETAPAPAPAGAGESAARIDPHPVAPHAAPAAAAPGGASSAGPAPGTLSLRFIVRQRETKAEIPAGAFDVRLLALDPIRDGGAGTGSTGASLPSAGVTTEEPRLDRGVAIGQAPSAQAPATYQGAPEQVLVTQPDGSTRTYLAGVRPGTYAMRITSKGRRMLLEVLAVKAEDRLVERVLEAE